MGATLAPTSSALTEYIAFPDPSFLQTLRQSEDQTWVGCPAELLYSLSAINSLRSAPLMAPERLKTVLELCNSLQNFSASTWAQDFPDPRHHESRSHLAQAYKTAVEVYASRIFGSLPGQDYLSGAYLLEATQSAIFHMLSIPAEDFHVKSLVWPAFVLGAETQIPELRVMIRIIFRNIWVSSCCYNARNAAEMLEKIWARDSPPQSTEKSWLDYIWEQEDSWLFL